MRRWGTEVGSRMGGRPAPDPNLHVVGRLNVIDAVPPGFSPTINHLVGVARSAGMADATPRTIHYWRSLDLISPPVRYGRGYRYPLASLAEADGLARWRRRRM